MNISSYRVLKWISVITLCMFRKQKMGNKLTGWLRIISFIFNENLCSIQQITFIHKITSLKRCEYLEIKEFLHTFQKKKRPTGLGCS